jgi:hypothetical protein
MEETTDHEVPEKRETPEAPAKRVVLRPKPRSRRVQPIYDTVEAAAAKLGIGSAALRARLRRAQRAEGQSIVADLGGGIRGFKFGKSWRIRFPET